MRARGVGENYVAESRRPQEEKNEIERECADPNMLKSKCIEMEELLLAQMRVIESLAKNLSIVGSTMLKNNPVLMKESLAKAVEEVDIIKNRCQAVEEERASIMLHLKESEEKIKKDSKRQTQVHKQPDYVKITASRQEKKREAPSPPQDTSRRDKREKTKDEEAIDPNDGMGEWTVQKEHRKRERRKERPEGRPKDKRPPNQAIKVAANEGTTYADIIRKMKETVDPKEYGAEILKIRRTQKKEILIVLDKSGNIQALNEAIVKAVGAQAKVNTLTRKTIVEIRDIDETVAVEEVLEAVSRRLDLPGNNFADSCRLRKGYGGLQAATILMTVEQAQQLLATPKIKIGWVNCRIRERRQVTQCYRCLGFGHISTSCNGPDRRNVCYRCGKVGHVVKDCRGNAQCILCKDRNMADEHLLGSNRCASFTAALNKNKLTQNA